jgi:hypothetical protein
VPKNPPGYGTRNVEKVDGETGETSSSRWNFGVTDPINHNLVKWEGTLGRGVGDAHSSGEDGDNRTPSERRGVTLFECPKKVRGASASNG